MQAVIAIPAFTARIGKQKTTELLMRPVAGVPLLKRIILTASRAGATDILLICPAALSDALSQEFSQEVVQYGSRIRVIQFSKFNPRDSSSWVKLEAHLNDQFLWIPWNWVTTKQFLTNLPLLTMTSVDWAKPAHISLHEVRDYATFLPRPSERNGVRVTSPESIARAERFLVAHSGKVLDGIHTSFQSPTLPPICTTAFSYFDHSERRYIRRYPHFCSISHRFCTRRLLVFGAGCLAVLHCRPLRRDGWNAGTNQVCGVAARDLA